MRIRFSSFMPLVALALPILGACSNETEGQPCDVNSGGSPSGTNDCESPLVCQQVTVTAGPRCCPQDLSRATTAECSVSSGGGVDASPSPPDAGVDAPGVDAAEARPMSDAGQNGPGESGSAIDAAADSPAFDAADTGATTDATSGAQD